MEPRPPLSSLDVSAPPKPRFVLLLGVGLAIILVGGGLGLAARATRLKGQAALGQLQRGDCFNLTTVLGVPRATKVACTKPHTDEIAGILRFDAADGEPYPGEDKILEFGQGKCITPVAEFYGTRAPFSTTQVFVLGPNPAAWKKGQRTVACSLREETAAKRTASYLQGERPGP